ncbi:MAG: stage 0 sporulation family protein [Acutalibacteraceae bacterium]
MTEIIGIRFRDTGKIYYFSPKNERFSVGDAVIVETARGIECARVSMANKMLEDDKIVKPLKSIVRKATAQDESRYEDNLKKEKRAYSICTKKIADFKLDMKLTGVEYSFDGSKIVFFFTADGRVDFRELVKALASEFHTRIELRQIGVRDEAKMLDGVGICGQPFCCARFLDDFQPVSIKMAKEQGLSPNPTKISGSCGRLMCCLKYEHDTYEKLLRETPGQGAVVDTPDGRGVVTDVRLIAGKVKVHINGNSDSAPASYNVKDVTLVSKGTHPGHRKRARDIIAEYDEKTAMVENNSQGKKKKR